jgi:hypothetical protein
MPPVSLPAESFDVTCYPWTSIGIVFTELDINAQRAKQKPRDIPLYKKQTGKTSRKI